MPTLQDLSAVDLASFSAVDGVLAKGHDLFGAKNLSWQPIVGNLPISLLLDADSNYIHPSLSYSRTGSILLQQQDGTFANASPNELRRSWDPVNGWMFEFDPGWTQTIQNTHDSSVWSNAGCVPARLAAKGPNGNWDANLLVEDTGTGAHYLSRPAVNTAAVPVTLQVVAKDLTGDRFLTLLLPTAAGFASNVMCTFDLRSGTYVASGLVEAAGMWQVADGYWVCWMRATPTSTATSAAQVRISTTFAATAQSFQGNGTSGMLIWCANLTNTLYPPPLVSNGVGSVTIGNATCGMAVPTLPAFSYGGTYVLNALIDLGLGVAISDGTFGNSSYLNTYTAAAGGRSSMNVITAGTGVADSAGTGPIAAVGAKRKFAFRVKDSSLRPYWDDAAGALDITGAVPAVNQLYVASNWANSGNRAAIGFKRLWIGQDLTDAQLTGI